jgi:hypothetical protein
MSKRRSAVTVIFSLLVLVAVGVAGRNQFKLYAATPADPASTQPDVSVSAREVVVLPGASRVGIQNALDFAGRRGLPVVLDPGTYKIDQTLVLPSGLVFRSGGATLLGTQPGAIVSVTDGGTIEGLQFQGAVRGVTGISGSLVRTRIRDCDFWTSLSYGVDTHGLLSRITDCRFGLAGDVPQAFQPIRIRSGDGSTNAWEIDHCAFYNAAGDCAVEVGDGYQLDFHHNNVERNRSRVAIKLAGLFTANIHDNWFENNSGESQVELLHDATNQIGNYVVDSHNNFWNLNGKGNRQAYLTNGAAHLEFRDESGTSWAGKRIGSDAAKVGVGHHRLVGYPE